MLGPANKQTHRKHPRCYGSPRVPAPETATPHSKTGTFPPVHEHSHSSGVAQAYFGGVSPPRRPSRRSSKSRSRRPPRRLGSRCKPPLIASISEVVSSVISVVFI